MDLGLAGRTALITGGSQGIGAATATVLAAEGVNLILVARNAARLEQTRQAILDEFKVDVCVAAHDLSKSEEIATLASRYRNVDILVNNAGSIPSGSLFEISEARWREGWDSKVFAYINMCRTFYPIIKERGGGVIVNVLGTGSLRKDPGYCCGGMGNAALDFFTQTLGASSPRDNIRVVGISPGSTDTQRHRKLADAAGTTLAGLKGVSTGDDEALSVALAKVDNLKEELDDASDALDAAVEQQKQVGITLCR